jgi:hypothetical protein
MILNSGTREESILEWSNWGKVSAFTDLAGWMRFP